MKNLIHSDSYKHFCIPIGFGTDCHMRHVSLIMRRVYLSLFICINRSFAVFSFLFFSFFCMCNPICLTWWGDMMFCIDLQRLSGWQQAWVQFKIWKIGRKSVLICVWENTYGFLHVCVCYLIWFNFFYVNLCAQFTFWIYLDFVVSDSIETDREALRAGTAGLCFCW